MALKRQAPKFFFAKSPFAQTAAPKPCRMPRVWALQLNRNLTRVDTKMEGKIDKDSVGDTLGLSAVNAKGGG